MCLPTMGRRSVNMNLWDSSVPGLVIISMHNIRGIYDIMKKIIKKVISRQELRQYAIFMVYPKH